MSSSTLGRVAGKQASGAVPEAAAAIIELLNSRPHATPALPDTLDDPETAQAILRPFGLPEGSPPPRELLDDVRVVRTDLMAVVADPGAAQAWADLGEHTSAVTVRHAFSAPGEVRLRQVSGEPVVGGIVLAVASLIAAGSWSRIRACANDDCAHVFYDTTRSRTQRWHSYEMCGNRLNVAAYRARRQG
ncbi:Conserved protein containing a Zn-ribbon-like motif, possibly RNA-binding [Nonomuraea maritima]|jgi:hypothetical protein|uniref:Conserved protein containing a Zn-ribbon-like motif, possibly RNA-binding n=1 Tax=Nonomuraea maritima TaxID=683260 RepID=A0A1G9FCI1_9ACTN|nr:Conserved protein containing a Zn-ribbon-like motif, possibly RNA-binding [Nonomuraea maritima]